MERLPWSLRFVERLEQEIPGTDEACDSTPQTVSGEDNLIIVKVSYDEWIKIWSSVMTGADICYPGESDAVRWSLIRNLECPVSMCDEVARSIDECEDVRSALGRAIRESDDIRRAIEQAPAFGAEMSEGQLSLALTDNDCDLDVLFAEITGLVDQLHTNNLDFLEIMAAASTPGKRLAQVISAIPVLETLPADDIINYVSKMYDEIVANYNAQWTTSLRDEYRCGLFCIARDKPGCELTYDDVFNYINARLGNAVSVGNLVASVVQYTLLGTWAGSTVVDIMMLNQVAIWRAAGNWLGVALRSLQMVIALGANIPDSDWEILCTDCASACGPAWSSITWYEGIQLGVVDDVYTVQSELDTLGAPNYVIRNTEYGDFAKGNYSVTSFSNLSSGTITQIYVESSDGSPAGFTSVEDANAACPMCVRFVQVYRPVGQGSFTIDIGIEN